MPEIQFSYAGPTDPLLKRMAIQLVETAIGKSHLERRYQEIRTRREAGENIFAALVRVLAIDIRYDPTKLARLPSEGPLVVVANHPFGALDGIALARLVAEIRRDYLVLTNSVLMRAPELHAYLLPVDFSEAPEAKKTNLRSRARARDHLARGGALIVFPSGTVATSPDWLGRRPAQEVAWQPFTSQLIQRSQATVVPVFFPGQNSRLFHIASHISMTLRLALLFHEVRRRIGTALPLVIGDPVPFAALAHIKDRQALADHLRELTYRLALEAGEFQPRPR